MLIGRFFIFFSRGGGKRISTYFPRWESNKHYNLSRYKSGSSFGALAAEKMWFLVSENENVIILCKEAKESWWSHGSVHVALGRQSYTLLTVLKNQSETKRGTSGGPFLQKQTSKASVCIWTGGISAKLHTRLTCGTRKATSNYCCTWAECKQTQIIGCFVRKMP